MIRVIPKNERDSDVMKKIIDWANGPGHCEEIWEVCFGNYSKVYICSSYVGDGNLIGFFDVDGSIIEPYDYDAEQRKIEQVKNAVYSTGIDINKINPVIWENMIKYGGYM